VSPARKPKQPARSASRRAPAGGDPRVPIAVALGVTLLLVFLGYWIFRGLGEPSVPSDAIAKVGDRSITKEEYGRALQQAAARQGLRKPPKPGSPAYLQLKNQAISDALDVVWIEGEAKDRGIEVSDREVAQQLDQIKKQNFRSEAQFQQFLARSGFSQQDVDTRVRLQILSQKIQQQVGKKIPKVTSTDISDYYDAAREQFQTPEQRNLRLVLNKDKSKVDAAKAALESDSSDAAWKKIAKKYSTDVASKQNGGERTGITPGLLEGALDKAVFDAGAGQLVGPLKTPLGYYVFEVTKVTPPSTTPLSKAQGQIRQTLSGQVQQNYFSSFIEDYRAKWTAETVCAKGFLIDRCENFTAPAPVCPPAQAKQGCPPPVTNIRPIAPGTALPLSTPQGVVQRPHPPGSGAAVAVPGLPGAIPGQPPVPGAPPGAAPPGAAPPGAAPPGAAPPAAPPGG
jgi:foldase protein PrsA